MSNGKTNDPHNYTEAIRQSGRSIYDPIVVGDPEFWIPSQDLEILLNEALVHVSLAGLPLRTRSKTVKTKICEALGYPVPGSFAKTQPRFPGQAFDTYVQKANNLQIWNEELSPIRRYVLIQVSASDEITRVRVVDGATLSLLDTTGTLTQKYQARLIPGNETAELISETDTDNLIPLITSDSNPTKVSGSSPIDPPKAGELLPIEIIFKRLSVLIGAVFEDAGTDQERNRGAALHGIVCNALGFPNYFDDGRFPDVRNQLLEVKLQTAPTIDLGLVCPNSEEPLDLTQLAGRQIRHCDVRYALFYATTDGRYVTLTHFFLTTGEDFFSRFPQFQGKVLNRKLQIPLPRNFFA